MRVSKNNIVKCIMRNAEANGILTEDSSSMMAVYRISRYWRELFGRATRHRSDTLPQWSEKEVAGANIIISALMFLSMEGCKNIEELIKDVVKYDHRQNETKI